MLSLLVEHAANLENGFLYICLYTHKHTHAYIHMYVYINTQIHIRIYMYLYTHTDKGKKQFSKAVACSSKKLSVFGRD